MSLNMKISVCSADLRKVVGLHHLLGMLHQPKVEEYEHPNTHTRYVSILEIAISGAQGSPITRLAPKVHP